MLLGNSIYDIAQILALAGDLDLGEAFFEAQLCAARADESDEKLTYWNKGECSSSALAEHPPKELRPASDHTGWRDPFIFQMPSTDNNEYAPAWYDLLWTWMTVCNCDYIP